jgi:GNAT superfamily N-acetyltransferase
VTGGPATPTAAATAAPVPATSFYEIRVLHSLTDLLESYRLRYDVYGDLGYVGCTLESRLEIDPYDIYAVPFGAFDLVTGEMIGTLRLIFNEVQPGYEALIRRVLEDFADPGLIARATASTHGHLPSVLSPRIAERFYTCNTADFPLVELSRYIIHPAHRGTGIARGLMELGIAHAMQHGNVFIVGGCLPEHLPMNARYGYQKLPNTDLDHFDHVGQLASVMFLRTDVLPEPTHTHIHHLLECMKSGAQEMTRELGHGSQAFYPFAAPHRSRRRTMEW